MILPEKRQSAGPGASLVAGDSKSLFSQFPVSANQESRNKAPDLCILCNALHGQQAVSTASRRIRKIPNVSVGYAAALCGNLK